MFDSDRPDGTVSAMDRESSAAPRDRMLDAAEAVVVRQGIANLTLDAVAAEAGISKGGLLHHFPSKDRLVEHMVARCAENWLACAIGSYESVPEGPGRMARAMLSHLVDAQSWTDQCRQSSSAVFAALAQNPALIQPMRAVYSTIREKLAHDGLPPGVGETVIAAMDGLWLYRVLGLASVDQELMDLVRNVLESLLKRPGAAPGRRGAAAPAKKPGPARQRPIASRMPAPGARKKSRAKPRREV